MKTLHIVPSIYTREDELHMLAAPRDCQDVDAIVALLKDAIERLESGRYYVNALGGVYIGEGF